jgi:curved DNA-binding protein CbpA
LDPKGYYSILGLSSNATIEEIHRAYRLLALKYHPDRNKSAFSHSTMIRLNAAYEVLSVPDRKYIYDIGEPIDGTFDNLDSTKYENSSEHEESSVIDGGMTVLFGLLLLSAPFVVIFLVIYLVVNYVIDRHNYKLTLKVTFAGVDHYDDSEGSVYWNYYIIGIDNKNHTHQVELSRSDFRFIDINYTLIFNCYNYQSNTKETCSLAN